MSTWGVARLADWCRSAGFAGDALVEAVAMAQAASGGDDHHVSNPSYIEALCRRGLFALRQCEAPHLSVGELFDPEKNTAAAFAHWRDMGGVWAWHPVWASGAATDALDHVRAVLERPGLAPAPGAAERAAQMLDYAGRFQVAMAQLRRQ
ncbi:MAG TPA: hypothetical protein VKU86_10500 [Acidimicrobiales bacterium]|nr:hypothetical protein [Acidimicrobiales bacterium]